MVLNALINDLTGRASETINPSTQRRDANGNVVNPLTLEEQQSRSNLIATLVAGITAATGGNINAAVTAAQIETENNELGGNGRDTNRGIEEQVRRFQFENIVRAIANGLDPQRIVDYLNTLPSALAQAFREGFTAEVQATAFVAINAALLDSRTTPEAAAILRALISDTTARSIVYDDNTPQGRAAINQLFNTESRDFYRSYITNTIDVLLRVGGQPFLVETRPVTQVRASNFFTPINRALGTRIAEGAYLNIAGLINGAQLPDVIGSFTSGLTGQVRGDRIYFEARNSTTIESFAYANVANSILGNRTIESLLIPAERGRFSPVTQVIRFSIPIPAHLRRPRGR